MDVLFWCHGRLARGHPKRGCPIPQSERCSSFSKCRPLPIAPIQTVSVPASHATNCDIANPVPSPAGTPESLASLSEHTAVVFRVPSNGKQRKWQLRSGSRNVEVLPPSRLCVDDGDALVRAAVLGMGIGQVPHYMVAEPIARRELIELLPQCRPRPMPIAAVMPSARMVPARVRALLDLIARNVDAVPPPPLSASVLRARASPARRPRSRR